MTFCIFQQLFIAMGHGHGGVTDALHRRRCVMAGKQTDEVDISAFWCVSTPTVF